MYVHRQLEAEITKHLAKDKSILLLGSRQTGKTTMMAQLPVSLSISFARPEKRLAYEQRLDLLATQVEALQTTDRKKPLVIIDEVQKIPFIMDAVQDLIDRNIAQFILSGSSARKLKRGKTINLLPGRVIPLHCDPLMLSECSALPNTIEDLLFHGSLPAVYLETDHAYKNRLLEAYVGIYLEEEIKAEALVRELGTFNRFLMLAAIESGHILNISKVSQDIGVTRKTVQNYYEILEDCLIAHRIEPLSKSLSRKRLTKSPKYLLFDMGVRRVAAKEPATYPEKYMGHLFEQWVGLELLHMLRFQPGPNALNFWHDHTGPEVDWVVSLAGQYIPIEVKWTPYPSLADAKHLLTFLNEYDNSTMGYIVCRAPMRAKLADNIMVIPWQELAAVVES